MNNKLPSREIVNRLREQYPVEARVELASADEHHPTLLSGDRGRVSFMDDTGAIFVDWDNGSWLGFV